MEEPSKPATKRKRNARAGKPPAFQFYPADWLSDLRVAAMTWEERGVYIHLLAYCWREGRIPTDPETLGRVLHMDPARAGSLWTAIAPCFAADGTHPRLSRERRAQDEYHKSQSANGKRGADERWRRHDSANGDHVAKDASASASASASAGGGRAESGTRDELFTQTEPTSPNGDGRARQLASLARWREEFARLWKAHPPRRGTKANKPKAWETYRALRPSLELAELIAAGHERACKSKGWQEGFVPDLHRWLKAKGWEDEHGAEAIDWRERFMTGDDDG